MQRIRRHHRHDDNENHERWVISYADFITLLFAFFVVMYSISSVNEGKYRVLSDALVSSFSNSSGVVPPVFDKPGETQIEPISIHKKQASTTSDLHDQLTQKEREIEEIIELNEISGKIERQFYKQIENQNISVKSNNDWIEVEIKSSLLFSSGIARLNSSAVPIISDLAIIVREYENPIQVEGFTDNIPINNEQYSSNWELSSSRAVAVLEVLIKNGVNPENLAAVGYGEFQPTADNNTLEGRSKNRRVVVIISKGTRLRREMFAGEELSARIPEESAAPEQYSDAIEKERKILTKNQREDSEAQLEDEQKAENTSSQWGIRLEDGRLLFTGEVNDSMNTRAKQ